jgi:subtilisin family serine protease
VAGVIALMKSANPRLSPAQLRRLLVQTAFEREGFRVLDAEAAVTAAMAVR